MNEWTIESLVAFESKIAELFNRGEIRSPIHLADGSETPLIEIFKSVKSGKIYGVNGEGIDESWNQALPYGARRSQAVNEHQCRFGGLTLIDGCTHRHLST